MTTVIHLLCVMLCSEWTLEHDDAFRSWGWLRPIQLWNYETKGGNHKQLKEWKAEHGA